MHPAVTTHRLQLEATDEMLIEHSRSGNLHAFEELFQRHSSTLLNYLFLMNRDAEACGSLLVETYVHFYRRLSRYTYRDNMSAELFKAANAVLHRASAISPGAGSNSWEALPLFDRSLLVLTRRCGLSMGEVSRILGHDTIKLMEKINALEAEGYREIEWPASDLQERDFISELRTRMQVVGQDRHKKTWLSIIAALTVALLATIGFFIFRVPVADIAVPVGRPDGLPEGRAGKGLKDLLIQELQVDRAAFFRPDEGFAEEKLIFVPGKGKVLSLDYELFRSPASVGVRFQLRPTDLSRFSALSVLLRGDEAYGFPDGLFIEFRKGGASVWRRKLLGLKNAWLRFDFPLISPGQEADSLVFLIDEQVSGPAKSGRIYIDQLVLTPQRS
jgi:hypothetical protein